MNFYRNQLTLWIVGIAVGCAFLFACASPAASPSTTSWMSGVVCGAGAHLSGTQADTSYGTTSQVSTTFHCLHASGAVTPANGFEVFVLQLGLSVTVALVAALALASLIGVARRGLSWAV